MPNRRYNQDQQRSNEPYNARSEYGRRRRDSNYGSQEQGRGEDYYEGDRSRYGTPPSGSFSGEDFGRGYSGDRGGYPGTYGGHGSSEGAYHSPYSYGDRTDLESEYQNRNRNFESPGANRSQNREMYRGDSGNERNYRDRGGREAGLFGGYTDRTDRSRYPESERGYYGDSSDSGRGRGYSGYNREQDRGWWDKAADEVSSWVGDEEAARRREMDHRSHGQFRGHGPRNYKRSDERIKEDINDRLTDHANLNASDIDVEVSGGEAVLTGTVASRYAKRMAEDIAESVSGVRNVENRLRVENKPSWISGVGDINSAGNQSKFQDISDSESETKSMSKNA